MKNLDDVLEQIGLYFLQQNQHDYVQTEQQIRNMGITNVSLLSDTVIIILRRPGLIIGKKGKIVEGLADFLSSKIQIIEDTIHDINDRTVPFNPLGRNGNS